MTYLVIGLVLFLGVHSIRIVADDWRTQALQQWGAARYKAVYTLISLLGFALIVWGFSVARDTPTLVWMPPVGMRHAAALLTWVAFVLLAAAYVPRNGIKALVHHPMVLGVKTWALAHLLANGMAAHLVLFGAFLVWSVADYATSQRRDRLNGVTYPAGVLAGTLGTVAIGTLAWAVFTFGLHGLLIGVKPLG